MTNITSRDELKKAFRQGEPTIQSTVVDITERKRVEDALRESEERYRSLYDSIPLSVWEEDWSPVKKMIDRLSSDGVTDWTSYFESHGDEVRRAYDLCTTLSLNPATLGMYRTPDKEATLRLVSSQEMTAAELGNFASWLANFAAGNRTFVVESEETRSDGTAFAARIRSSIPPEYADNWARVITTVEDITDRKRAEEALQEARGRLGGLTSIM